MAQEHKLGAIVVSYLDQPSYRLKSVDGIVAGWAASLVKPATPEQSIEYWRGRALVAEDKIANALS